MESLDLLEALEQGFQMSGVLLMSVIEHASNTEVGEDYDELLLSFVIGCSFHVQLCVPVTEFLELLHGDFPLEVIKHDDVYHVIRVACPVIVVRC